MPFYKLYCKAWTEPYTKNKGMKNINYDLLKLLHTKLDTVWRLEKYYINDAKEAHCHSRAALEAMLEDERRHVEALRQEIMMRVKSDVFD